MSMNELLYPRTDGGVVAQILVAVVVFGVLAWLVRRTRDLVVFVAGLGLFTASLMALRTVH